LAPGAVAGGPVPPHHVAPLHAQDAARASHAARLVCPVAGSIQATHGCNRRQASGVVQHRPFEASGDAVVLLPLQVAAGLALANALPRFEEEGYFCFLTRVADRQEPLLLDRPCPRAALPAHEDPV